MGELDRGIGSVRMTDAHSSSKLPTVRTADQPRSTPSLRIVIQVFLVGLGCSLLLAGLGLILFGIVWPLPLAAPGMARAMIVVLGVTLGLGGMGLSWLSFQAAAATQSQQHAAVATVSPTCCPACKATILPEAMSRSANCPFCGRSLEPSNS